MSPPIPEITSPEYGEFLKEATDRVRDPDWWSASCDSDNQVGKQFSGRMAFFDPW